MAVSKLSWHWAGYQQQNAPMAGIPLEQAHCVWLGNQRPNSGLIFGVQPHNLSVIRTGIRVAVNIIEMGKLAIQAIQKSDNLKANQLMLDIQQRSLDMQHEIDGLRRTIVALEGQLAEKEQLTFNQGTRQYTKEGDPIPFCPTCWENDRNAIHLVPRSGGRGNDYFCGVCHINKMGICHTRAAIESGSKNCPYKSPFCLL